jgi:type VI secretion system secreted protein Hcp
MRRLAHVSLASVFMLLALKGGAFAADKIYMTATGVRQGLIKGGVTQRGLENWMQVLQMDHGVVSPRDPGTGLPTGQRIHKPLVVKLPVDQSTPRLIEALVSNENLTSVEVAFYREFPSPGGVTTRRKVFTIKLTNANVASVEESAPSAATPAGPTVLDLSFTYQKIEWTWVDGGITATDDWEAPVM